MTWATARERVHAMEALAAIIAHELRAAVMGVTSAAQLLRYSAPQDPVAEKSLGRILQEAERLSATPDEGRPSEAVDVVRQLRHHRGGEQVEGDEDEEDDAEGDKKSRRIRDMSGFRGSRFRGQGSRVPGFRVQGPRRHEQDENREARLNAA